MQLSDRHVVVTGGAGGIGRVVEFMALRGSDPERRLKGMRRIVREARATAGG